jgi:hypothetical protein
MNDKMLVEKSKGKNNLEDLSVDGDNSGLGGGLGSECQNFNRKT